VILIVGLLAPPSVTDDRIAFTNRASQQNELIAVSGPIGFQLVQRGGKWDKKNRDSQGFRPGVDHQDLSRKRALPPEEKKTIPTGEE
jgi:hypothetical protein